ncbi:MAG: Mov34/MPN/PAD-1 family protein [Solirubrobacteraceae bacterium]
MQMELTYTADIPDPLLTRIGRLAGASADGRETGGILLGHDPSTEGIIRVTHAGDAGPAAERRVDFFLRDLQHSRRLAARAWLTDGSDWVGEWHTHPAGGARPSTRDLDTYRRILASTPAFEVFLSVIITPGTRDDEWRQPQLHLWVVQLAASGELATHCTDNLSPAVDE